MCEITFVRFHVAAVEEKAFRVENKYALFGFFGTHACANQPFTNGPRNSDAAGSCAVNDKRFIGKIFVAQMASGENTRECDSTSALDVVVKRRALIAVTIEYFECRFFREIFPLDDRLWPFLPYGLSEAIHEAVVLVTCKSFLSNTEVVFIVDQIHAIGADVERDRHRMEGAYTAGDCVQGHLADGDR